MATEQVVVDEGAKLAREIEAHTLRLQKNPPKTIEGLAGEMAGTVLAFVGEALAQQMQFRNWAGESLGLLDERVADLEGEMGSRIVPEDAEKLLSLIEAVKLLIARNLETALPAEVKRGLEEMRALADECERLVEDAAVGDDEDEDDEEESDQPEGDEDGTAASASPES